MKIDPGHLDFCRLSLSNAWIRCNFSKDVFTSPAGGTNKPRLKDDRTVEREVCGAVRRDRAQRTYRPFCIEVLEKWQTLLLPNKVEFVLMN